HLPRSVQHEVELLLDEPTTPGQPLEHRERVVIRDAVGPTGVEEPRHAQPCGAPPAPSSGPPGPAAALAASGRRTRPTCTCGRSSTGCITHAPIEQGDHLSPRSSAL